MALVEKDVDLDAAVDADEHGPADLVLQRRLLHALADDGEGLARDVVPALRVLVADDAHIGHGDADHAAAVGEVAGQPKLRRRVRVQAEGADLFGWVADDAA